jgi:hypothetical protein
LVSGCLIGNRPPEEKATRRLGTSLLSPDDWMQGDSFGDQRLEPSAQFETPLIADRLDSRTYTKMDPRSRWLGSLRAGRVIWGKKRASYRGCRKGWYALAQGGYACAGGSFRRLSSNEVLRDAYTPALDSMLPYDYVQVTTDGAPLYSRIPVPDEESAPASGTGEGPRAVQMTGDYFLAVNGVEEAGGRRFYRTLRDKYVRAEDVATLSRSTLHGTKNPLLPLAFVIDLDAPVFILDSSKPEAIGSAERYWAFAFDRIVARNGERYAVSSEGFAIPTRSVRVARARPRPSGVGRDEKWIVVDLSEQTLVAYEGDRVVLATLVSSGKAGHETPVGSFRIQRKYVSKTMSGDDPVDGHYEVEEVPWTMFYHRAYALHGAYWHDEFGRVRSHGCTNLAPADARWLLRWTDPPLPTGWHGISPRSKEAGTRVYIQP